VEGSWLETLEVIMRGRSLLLGAMLAALIAAGPVAAHDGAHGETVGGPADNYVFALPEPGSYSLPAIRPAAGGPVLDEDGQAHDLRDLVRGQVTVLAFIYTQCADVCPTATLRLSQLHDVAARDGEVEARLRLVTMSFDPENDSPDVMREHAAQWRGPAGTAPEWLFLTAPDAASLQPIMAAYDQTVGRKPDPNDPTGRAQPYPAGLPDRCRRHGAQHLQPRFPRSQSGAGRRAHAADGARRGRLVGAALEATDPSSPVRSFPGAPETRHASFARVDGFNLIEQRFRWRLWGSMPSPSHHNTTQHGADFDAR
jgi:protein SCO1